MLLLYFSCVYLEGNLEINNFDPYNSNTYSREKLESDSQDQSLDDTYDFSFLDNIKEITGYLIISGTRLKSLRLKSLEIIRGKHLFKDQYSLYIQSNVRLEKLDFVNLKGTKITICIFVSFFRNLIFHLSIKKFNEEKF